MINVDELRNQTSEYDVITFDVFDTLIIRDIPKPSELFRYEYRLFGKALRIFAESLARKSSKNDEVTLADIYKFLPYNLNREIEFEKRICRANPKMLEFYNSIKDSKKIYAISDMYLPEEILKDILNESGYDIENVFVSSSYGKRKTTGELYRVLLEKENINPNDVCHVGDNTLSDVDGAKIAGIDSAKIEKHQNELSYRKINRKNYELNSFINHGLNEIEDPTERIGYEVVGPIILGFCQWVHDRYNHYGFDKMFFLARDMRFTYEMYKNIYPHDKVEYLCVSRKSFQFAKDNPDEFVQYLKEMDCYGNVSIVDTGWIGHAQVEIEKYAKMIEADTDIGGLYLGAQVPYRNIKRSMKSEVCYYNTFFGQLKCELYPPFMETLIGSNEKQVVSYSNGKPKFDREIDLDQTSKIKTGAQRFIDEWISVKSDKLIDKKEAVLAFERMFKYPQSNHIDLLGDFEYENIKSTKLVTISEGVNYISNLKLWFSDLSDSGWKGAFFSKNEWYFRCLFKPYMIINSIRIMLTNR